MVEDSRPAPKRAVERRRAAALARHYRDVEHLSIQEIARRIGRAPATVKAYLYDPTGEKGRAVKRRYQGTCRGCGAPTSARNGKGDAYAYCSCCRPGAAAPTRSRAWVREAMRDWERRYGRPPSSTDWSRTHARRRGGEALQRLADRDWPSSSTVIDLYGTSAAARTDALNASMSEAPVPPATQAPPTPRQLERVISPPGIAAASHTLVAATPAGDDCPGAREMTATTTATGG
jgi:AcrR family transcriptional regulator